MDLVKRKKIKEYINDMNISIDVYKRLDELCVEILNKGVERAKANGRRTLQGRDL